MSNNGNVTIQGNIGKDPVVRSTTTGKQVLQFSVALYTGKDVDGKANPPYWVNVDLWGDLAKANEGVLHKGSNVRIEGYAKKPHKYTAKDGREVAENFGVTGRVVEVIARQDKQSVGDEIPF